MSSNKPAEREGEARGREETSRWMSRWIGAQENTRKWTHGKYYDPCHALAFGCKCPPLSPLSPLRLGEARAMVLWAVRAHTYTYANWRGCTYIALLCNDGNFSSLTRTHPHTMHHSFSLSSSPPRMAVSWLRDPSGPFHRHSLTLELLHWRSCLTQTRGRRAGARGSGKALGLTGDGGEFGRCKQLRLRVGMEMAGNGRASTWRWLLTCARVRSFTSISSSTDLGVAPAGGRHERGEIEIGWARGGTVYVIQAWSVVVVLGTHSRGRRGARRRGRSGRGGCSSTASAARACCAWRGAWA
jgi:hypothetical protein